MQGNTERDGCGGSNAVGKTTAGPEEEGRRWCVEVCRARRKGRIN